MDETTQTRERQARHLRADPPVSLEELAATANREHELCEQQSREALTHGLAAGRALLLARDTVEPGAWFKWLGANFNGAQRTATAYMRFATYSEHLKPSMTFADAQEAVSGLPDIRPRGGPLQYEEELRQTALALLKDTDLTQREIGDRLGVSQSSIAVWKNPAKRRALNRASRKRRREAAEALARVESEREIKRAVRKAGAALAEAYSMAERMSRVLDQALNEAAVDEAREALTEAVRLRNLMRDEIVRALGAS